MWLQVVEQGEAQRVEVESGEQSRSGNDDNTVGVLFPLHPFPPSFCFLARRPGTLKLHKSAASKACPQFSKPEWSGSVEVQVG
jgi:hypothetical protein